MDARERIHDLLRRQPGLSTRQVARLSAVNESTADYHLRRLRRAGRVTEERVGRERLWYAAGCGLCPVLRRAVPAFRREEVALVARVLSDRPLTVRTLAEATGLDVGPARWAAHVLGESGILVKSGRGLLLLADGGEVCVQKAIQGERCAMWGRCPLSRPGFRSMPASQAT